MTELRMKQFQKERMVGAVAGARKALDATVEYLKQREAFGKPLIAKQYIQFKLAELSTQIELARQLNYHCARMIAAGEDCVRETSMAKLASCRLSREVADWGVQFHGGYGYMNEYPISRYWRDSRLGSIGGGADEVMMYIISKLENYAA